jgi:hypothetical protein
VDPRWINFNDYRYSASNPALYIDYTGEFALPFIAVVVVAAVISSAVIATITDCSRRPGGCSGIIPRPRYLPYPPSPLPISPTMPSRSEEGGRASGPAPYDHYEEHEALYFTPDHFGGREACERLAHAIRVLRAMIMWRRTDLNPNSPSYRGHLQRIALLAEKLQKLESVYRSLCGGDVRDGQLYVG